MADPWKSEAKAAAVLRECRAALAARRTTVIREVVGGEEGHLVDWRHYPDGEVYDPGSHVQYFYHRHPAPTAPAAASGPAEAGHFHLFLRGDGIPAETTPLLLPEMAVANAPARQSAPLRRGRREEVCHLVAIGADCRGEPVRLFTTNRWVTGETWYRADDMIGMLDRVRFDDATPRLLASRWIEALVRLFRREIAALLRDRDRAVIEWRWRWPRSNVFEDPRLETISSVAIDLDARLAAVDRRAADAAAAVSRRPHVRHLPSMGDGWGA